jgi:hypothetical protein
MALKDYFGLDMQTFFNTDEFAETHIVNGTEMDIVLDEDLLKERQANKTDTEGRYISGIYNADVLFHVQKSIYGDSPAVGEIVDLDGEIYRVADVQEDANIYSISLAANDS